MKRLILTLLVLLFTATSTAAISNYFVPSEVGSSAEMIGRGNIEGFSNTSDELFNNPSSLFRTRKFTSALFATQIINEVDYKNISASYRVNRKLVLGAGYMGVTVDDIIRTYVVEDDPNQIIRPGGTFGYLNAIGKLSFAYSMNRNIHFGSSFNYYQTELDDVRGKGYNADIGLTYYSKGLQIAFAAKNILPNGVTFTRDSNPDYNEQEALPIEFVASIQAPWKDFIVYGQLKNGGRLNQAAKSFGIQYHPSFLSILEISAGYKEFPVLDEINNNLTLGLGLNVFNLKFNYAYETSEHIVYNHKHYFSVAVRF